MPVGTNWLCPPCGTHPCGSDAFGGRGVDRSLRVPTLANSWQNFLAIKLQEARLILPWCMEDKMSEAEFDVGTDLLQMLFGVTRDEPAPMGLIGNSSCLALHFTGIFDACFVFGGKCQCGPDAC